MYGKSSEQYIRIGSEENDKKDGISGEVIMMERPNQFDSILGENVGRNLSQEEIDLLIKRMALQDSQKKQHKSARDVTHEKTDETAEMTFEERLKAGVKVDERVAVQKTQEAAQSKAVLKVDEKTLRKMAFEVCQKNGLDPMQVNTAGIDDLKTLIDYYSDELENPIEIQEETMGEKPVQEGMEI